MHTERGNGANVIVTNGSEILVVRQNYGEKKWMLPGGEIVRGESPGHAAQEETEEETGLIINEQDLCLLGYLVQRPNGIVFLFETKVFSGTISIKRPDEILEARFMSTEEIVSRGEEFLLGYRRMILRYLRCKNGIDAIPFEGRLSDKVEFPKNSTITYSDTMISV